MQNIFNNVSVSQAMSLLGGGQHRKKDECFGMAILLTCKQLLIACDHGEMQKFK